MHRGITSQVELRRNNAAAGGVQGEAELVIRYSFVGDVGRGNSLLGNHALLGVDADFSVPIMEAAYFTKPFDTRS